MSLPGSVVIALGAHWTTTAVLVVVGAASLRLTVLTLPLLLVAAAVGAVLAHALADPLPTGARVAAAWFVASLAHHYLAGLTPRWADRPVSGLGHVAWDLVVHLPPVVLAAVAIRRGPREQADVDGGRALMDLRLAGKRVLVTGAGEGMGRATVLGLADEGVHLGIVARTRASLDAVAEEARRAGAAAVDVFATDLTEPNAADAAVHEFAATAGGIDALVNTVGLCEVVPEGILGQDDGYWDRAYQSVLLASVRTCRAAVPLMVGQGGGAIVNTSAMSSRHYLPVMSHYSAMKVALGHFTKNLAREFGDQGLRANAVLPGMIESESVARRKQATIAETGWSDDEFFRYVNEKYDHCTWGARLGRPDEIADAIVWLVSERASYVNGEWLNVDGGST